jgi:multiple sugar transport system ATP-binding protein
LIGGIMARIELERVNKTFSGGVLALSDVTLDVADGELVVIVGPSGSGKTTALRIVAGLEAPTAGCVRIGGRDMVGVAPRDRDVAMVFQQPVVYPHLSVRDNVGYSLKARGTSASESREATESIARRLGIAHLLERAPGTLSGGEAQRVVIARAAVRRPACLLLDEPLSNLDAPLRRELRREFATLHKSQRATTLFVTHDQEGALALAERIVVLRGGKIEQIGAPADIYDQPANRFVAGYFGSPPASFFPGSLAVSDGRLWFQSLAVRIATIEPVGNSLAGIVERPIVMAVRPEAVRLAPWPNHNPEISVVVGTIRSLEFAGNRTVIEAVTTDGAQFRAAVATGDRVAVGESRRFFVDLNRLMFFAADDSGAALSSRPIPG